MSSTNRGAERHTDDFYRTPASVTKAILDHLPCLPVLDPCCGDGAILEAVVDHWQVSRQHNAGLELDTGRAALARGGGFTIHERDALDPEPWTPGYRALIVSNPPFALAEEFVRRAIAEAAGCRGTVAMLLRLAFLETAKRRAFHREHPADVFVLSKRPSFTENGKTDSCAYAWMVWGPGRGGLWQVL